MESGDGAAMKKILLTLSNDKIAPRFDLAIEVMIVCVDGPDVSGVPKSVLLPGPSVDELCGLILKEEISTLICGGIEEEHYQFLSWKKVEVFDRVIGGAEEVIKRLLAGKLLAGDIIKPSGQTEATR